MKSVRFNPLASLVMAAALTIGLAACGGSSKKDAEPVDPGPTPAETQLMNIKTADSTLAAATKAMAADQTDATVMAAETAAAALSTALTAATDVAADVKAGYQSTLANANTSIATAKQALQDAKDTADAAARAAMAAKGKALMPRLGSTITSTALTSTTLTVTPAATAAPNPVLPAEAINLKAGDSAGSLGSWKGKNYALTTGTGDAKVTNTAMVYTNQGAGKKVAFSAAVSDNLTDDDGNKSGVYDVGGSADSNIAGSDFPTAGTKTFTNAAPGQDEVEVTGTYASASGKYFCEGTCTAQYTADGLTLSGAWEFKPNTGAMVSDSDDNYLYFGWWLRETASGPTHSNAFAGVAGTVTNGGTLSGLSGTATYSGKAAGKFAYYNPLDKSGDAGHFTADASLTAKFGSATATNSLGITGTIDNFMANGASVPWSVSLKRSAFGENGAIDGDPTTTADDDDAKTVWSINGNPASAAGSWSGTMYDEATGTDDDGSNVPTTVTGTFSSEYGSTHSMVGAFAAKD